MPVNYTKHSLNLQISMMAAASLVLFIFEFAIPTPMPWMKPGLANLVTLVALTLYGAVTAFKVTFLRITIGGLILGKLMTPTFILSIVGGVVALLAMTVMVKYFRKRFSLVGISIVGAFFHNLTQVFLADILLVKNHSIYWLLPLMTLSALFSGFFVGVFAHYTVMKLSFLLNPQS